MRTTTTADAARQAGGAVVGDASVAIGPDVVIDSRAVTPGALFVAVAGERFDGHDFVATAVASGAAAVLVDRELAVAAPQIVAADTVAALSSLAREQVALARAAGTLSVALTGSSGKTSTKDLIAQVLADAGPTVAPAGSLNNEIGVPLTCCRVDEQTRFLVSELGARGIGHITWLTGIVAPDIALVLNVGVAHLGEFGGLEVTAQAKGELVEAVGADGWAILNANDPRVAAMASRTSAQVGWFAVGAVPDVVSDLVVTATDVTLDDLSRPSFTLVVTTPAGTSAQAVSLDLVGAHHAANAAAAAAVAVAAGIDPSHVAASLNSATARSAWRMALTRRPDGVLVLNDAYNANPDSMRAALATLVSLVAGQRRTHPDARGYAVLGDMLELGPDAGDLHRSIGALAAVDGVLAIGDHARDIVAGAASIGVPGRVVTRDEVTGVLDLAPGDVVLVKASRGLRLETVAEALMEGANR